MASTISSSLRLQGHLIKEYIANYFLHVSDVTFDMTNNRMKVHQHHAEPWKVMLVDTGEKTMTGGRLKRVANYLIHDAFCLTNGDGVGHRHSRIDRLSPSPGYARHSDCYLSAWPFQRSKLAVTTVSPPSRKNLGVMEG